MISAVPLKIATADAKGYRLVHGARAPAGDERTEVIAALLAPQASISPKYFYDELGCAIYGAICHLPEYYPTRTEVGIFREHRGEIAHAVGQGGQLVDLGAGDCAKAEGWLPFLNPARYLAVDIAEPEIERALARLAPDHPAIEMVGVVTDFTRGLDLEAVLDERSRVFFYPGSSIGNFTPAQALVFLRSVQRHCAKRAGSGLLIGVDGKKDRPRLEAAYDDALGVTAAFNRNALQHLNRRFGFDFALEGYAHRGLYNEAEDRVEMHLESVREQDVHLGSHVRHFAQGERIHSENSYKYPPGRFEALLREAGFSAIRAWASPDKGYTVYFAS
jgi:dimethylhistidine N-methyltransferase